MSGIFEAYLSGTAGAFLGDHFTDAGARRRAVLRAARPLDAAVAAALEAQDARLPPCPARSANVDTLRRGAAAVVTGQQVGLFLGPLYTIYKAASAVRLARALAEESGRPVVPVFWLQTEDHDLPEIASCNVPCARGSALSLELPAPPGERISIAHRVLPDDVAGCVEKMRAEISRLEHGDEHAARLARHYRPGAGWGEAFAGLLAETFAGAGLVVLDPRDAKLGEAAAAVHRRALVDAVSISAALEERGRELEAHGFAPTVHVRPASPLSFFHPHGAAGPRFRLDGGAGKFRQVGGAGEHTLAELLADLDHDPLRFSTSALLRPILQDTLLPTAAYVGGPAEVAYFAQLAPLYAAYDLPMPLVVPRARFRLLEEKTLRLLERLGIGPQDAPRPDGEILAMHGPSAANDMARRLLPPFEAALAELRREHRDLDIDAAVEKARATIAGAVDRLESKIVAARHRQDRQRSADVTRLKQFLFPHGAPQERFYGFSYFAARYGERAFVERILAAADPFDATPKDVALGQEQPS